MDRLCIIQDSAEDWQQEAGRMTTVYQNATLTLSASCASGEDHGFFRNRDPQRLQPLRLQPLQSGTPTHGLLFVCETFFQRLRYLSGTRTYTIHSEIPDDYDMFRDKLGLLGDRAWVYQERLLSPRVLYFAEEQVHWECREEDLDEMSPVHSHRLLSGMVRNRQWDPDRYSYEFSDDETRRWHRCVQRYGELKLTFPQDRLTALSGLAREYFETQRSPERMRSGKDGKPKMYCAGLWEGPFLEDLCWYATTSPTLLPAYVAPS